MLPTRAQGVSALEHIVRVVLNQSTDSPVSKMLTHVSLEMIHDLLGLDHADIDDLTYVDDETEKKLSLGHREMLRAFVAFVIYREETSAPVGDNWLGITQGEFDDFRAGAAYLIMRSSRAPTLDNSTSNAHIARSRIVGSKKGIKHDASLPPTFKEDKQWDHSKRNTVVHAHDQDVAEVLEEGYSPVNQEDKQVLNKASVELSLSSFVEVSSSITDTVPVISEPVSPVSDVISGDDTVVVMHQDSDYTTNVDVTTIGDVMHGHNDNPKDDGVSCAPVCEMTRAVWISPQSFQTSFFCAQSSPFQHTPAFSRQQVQLHQMSEYSFVPVTLYDLHIGSDGDVNLDRDDCKKFGCHVEPPVCSHDMTLAGSDLAALYHIGSLVDTQDVCNDSSDKLYYDTDSKSLVNELAINSVQACNLVSTMSLRASIMHPLWDSTLTNWPTFINSARLRSTSHPPPHLSIMLVSAYPFLQVNLHDLHMGSEGDVDDTPEDMEEPDDLHPHDDSAADDQCLINATKCTGKASNSKASSLSPTDIR